MTHPLSNPLDIEVYSVPADRHGTPTHAHPILLSYLDVVVQGYLREFGRDGVERFFATTSGWDAPILNDRAEPRYPRYQSLSAQETRCVDDHLMELSARIITRTEVATG